MIKYEGLILGGSSGINIMGAIKLAKEIGPNKNIVTIFVIMEQNIKVKSSIKNS